MTGKITRNEKAKNRNIRLSAIVASLSILIWENGVHADHPKLLAP
jgi:hypothetical protein